MNNQDFLDFSTAPTHQNVGGVIPNGTLAFATVGFSDNAPRDQNGSPQPTNSQSSDSAYLDLTFKISAGPHKDRVVYDKFGVRGSEKWINQSRAAIRAMLEVGRSSQIGAPAPLEALRISGYHEIAGLTVAIKISVESDTDQHGQPVERNRVRAVLTPNPDSPTSRDWARLIAGDTEAPVPPPAAAGQGRAAAPFGQQAAAPAAQQQFQSPAQPANASQPFGGAPAQQQQQQQQPAHGGFQAPPAQQPQTGGFIPAQQGVAAQQGAVAQQGADTLPSFLAQQPGASARPGFMTPAQQPQQPQQPQQQAQQPQQQPGIDDDIPF